MTYKEQPKDVWDYILISNLILDDLKIDDAERKTRLDDLRREVLEKYSQEDVQLFDKHKAEQIHKINITRAYANRPLLKM